MQTTLNKLRLPKYLIDDFNLLAEIEDEMNSPYLSEEGFKVLMREHKNFLKSIKRIDKDYLEAW